MTKTKILFVSADPKVNYRLKVEQEFNCIKRVLKGSENREKFVLESSFGTTYRALRESLCEHKPSIVHFSGHGIGEAGIILVDDNGKKQETSTSALVDLFRILQEDNQKISCVIFNACHGAFQAKEITKYIKYSIGMSYEISDDYAIEFAEGFYTAIFSNKPFESAFELGRNSILDAMTKINHQQAIPPKQNASTWLNFTRTFLSHIERKRKAIHDPDTDEQKASYSYDKIPQLFVNKSLEHIDEENQVFHQKLKILSFAQWNELYFILLKIDFGILKNVCRYTLEEYFKDVESKLLSLKDLLGLKEILLEQYPAHEDAIIICKFATHLIDNAEVDDGQKSKIKSWLKKLDKRDLLSKINSWLNRDLLPNISLNQKVSSKTILNSYLLVSIIPNTGVGNRFSLKADLIDHFDHYQKEYKLKPITSRPEEINEISLNENENFLKKMAPYIEELIYTAIKQIPDQYNLTIELFVPYRYLREPFDLCDFSIKLPGNREKKRPLGVQYQFAVRCLDIYDNKEYLVISNELKKIWNKIKENFNQENFKNAIKIAQLPENNQEEYFENLFYNGWESGVPIFLWSRCLRCIVDDGNCNVEQKFREILKIDDCQEDSSEILFERHLSKIFENIHNLRKDAYKNGDRATEYLGYHLGFICDRPDRIPAHLNEKVWLQGSN